MGTVISIIILIFAIAIFIDNKKEEKIMQKEMQKNL